MLTSAIFQLGGSANVALIRSNLDAKGIFSFVETNGLLHVACEPFKVPMAIDIVGTNPS